MGQRISKTYRSSGGIGEFLGSFCVCSRIAALPRVLVPMRSRFGQITAAQTPAQQIQFVFSEPGAAEQPARDFHKVTRFLGIMRSAGSHRPLPMLKEAFYRLERCRFFMRKASLPIVKRTGISASVEERELHLISSNLHRLREIETWTGRICRNRRAPLTKADFLVGKTASFRAENESNAPSSAERREAVSDAA